MKLSVVFLVLLPLVKTSLAATVRARRENVLSFLNDALRPSAVPRTTEYRKPQSKPVTENNSEDTSDAKSSEGLDATGFKDAAVDVESHETMVKNVEEPSRRRSGMDRDTVVQDQGSREHTGPDSEEEVMTEDTQMDRQFVLSPFDVPGREENVNGFNEDLTPDQSRDVPDWDSAEENRGRLAAAGDDRDTDYDDTRENTSLETDANEQLPAHFSVPAKSRSFR